MEHAINCCSICQSADKSAKPAVAPLLPIPWPERAWQKLALDIVGPFGRAKESCKFAITLIDFYSKWPEVCFVSNVTSETVMKFLTAVFSREGYPDELVTDHEPQLTSTTFEDFLRQRGIKHSCSSIYYPQSNGQIERFNRVLKDFVQLASLEQRPLDTAVLEYLAVYRSTPQATTGMPPAVLLHGRAPRTMLDIVGRPSPRFFGDPSSEMAKLRERVKTKQKYSKEYTDRKRGAKTPKFRPGDSVRVKKPTIAKKGDLAYSKPQKILGQKGPSSFILDDHHTWNASRLSSVPQRPAGDTQSPVKPMSSPSTSVSRDFSASEVSDEGEDVEQLETPLDSGGEPVEKQVLGEDQSRPLPRKSTRERRPPAWLQEYAKK